MRYDTVVFDLDGTLLNTLQDLADAANYVCRANGWPEHTLDEYRYFVGNGIPKLCRRFAPETARDEASQKEVLAAFSARYAAHKEDTTAPYLGIEEMLDALSAAGVRCGVLTNKEHTLARGVMEHYFPGRFEFVQGAVPGVPAKPDPTALHHLLARMGADESRTLFVGDSDVDIHTAHNAGLPGAGVLWGFRTEEELTAAGAEALAATPADLARYILGGAEGVHTPDREARAAARGGAATRGLLLESPVGPLWLTAQGGALTGCWFVNGRFAPELPGQPPRKTGDPVLAEAERWLKVYFSGRDPGPTPPLAAEGTPFQRQVWRRLAQVPWGTTTSYGALAADIAAEKGIPKMSARAVGGAVGRNPISLFLPCHRVLGAGGRLTGYGGGLENKIYLLKLEGIPFRP